MRISLYSSLRFRFLLTLLIRLRRALGRTALALGARLASLWRSIVPFTRCRDQSGSHIRLCASNAQAVVGNNASAGHPQTSEPPKEVEESGKTLAALPVLGIAHWESELSKYQTRTLNHKPDVDALPATPEHGSQRYSRRIVDGASSPDSLVVPAGQQTLLEALPPLPEGWRRHVHPEGNVFYYHEGLRLFTESDISRDETETEILSYATRLILQAKQNDHVTLDQFTEIVVNLNDKGEWCYYFVDHTNRLLFWVHEVRAREDLHTDLQAITGFGHIKYLVEARYWYAPGGISGMSCIVHDAESRAHCEYYPHKRILPPGVFEDIRGMLNYAKTDMMTADSSTSPFTQDELVATLGLVTSFKDDKIISDAYSIWVIARLMAFFTDNQFMNFCGQPYARLNADTPLFEHENWSDTISFKITNVFLFWSLSEHAIRLQRVWVDGIIIQPRWKDFINRLTAELARYTIFSTVMLAVNFSFLAVPGVVIPGTPASAIQIIIYCSIVSTIGSILFSLALLNLYSDPRLMDASPAAEVMKTLSQKKWGMVRFAITHSLPNACLLWSILLFATALAVQIFSPKEHSTVATLGTQFLILLLFGFVSIRIMWLFFADADAEDEEPPEENDQRPTERSPCDPEQGFLKCCAV